MLVTALERPESIRASHPRRVRRLASPLVLGLAAALVACAAGPTGVPAPDVQIYLTPVPGLALPAGEQAQPADPETPAPVRITRFLLTLRSPIADLPLDLGNTWVYSFSAVSASNPNVPPALAAAPGGVRLTNDPSQALPPPLAPIPAGRTLIQPSAQTGVSSPIALAAFTSLSSTFVVTDRVVLVSMERNARYFVAQIQREIGPVDGTLPNLRSFQERTAWYVVDLAGALQVFTRRGALDLASLSTDQLALSYVFPLREGAHWQPWPGNDAERTATGLHPLTTPAGTFSGCYQLYVPNLRGYDVQAFCPGLGVVYMARVRSAPGWSYQASLVHYTLRR